VVWKSSQQVWAELHERAFRHFGGCPQYVVLDNLKEGVLKPDLYEPELNPVYTATLKHYGVVADPARVRDPNRKGPWNNGSFARRFPAGHLRADNNSRTAN
jgi:transposase